MVEGGTAEAASRGIRAHALRRARGRGASRLRARTIHPERATSALPATAGPLFACGRAWPSSDGIRSGETGSGSSPHEWKGVALKIIKTAWRCRGYMQSKDCGKIMHRVALVTGGSRGIGCAIVQNFMKDHCVAATWLSTPPAPLLEGALAIQADLMEKSAPKMIVSAVMERFGRLDVIVNNAGLIEASALDCFDAEAAGRMFQVNLLAAQSLLSAALPYLLPGSAIVNISSVNSVLPPYGAALYGASKAAQNLWTRAMAKELGGRQIRVNAVAPGAVNIPEEPRSDELVETFARETALGRIASLDDIARAVRFLASDEASFITGEILTVSGGYRL